MPVLIIPVPYYLFPVQTSSWTNNALIGQLVDKMWLFKLNYYGQC